LISLNACTPAPGDVGLIKSNLPFYQVKYFFRAIANSIFTSQGN